MRQLILKLVLAAVSTNLSVQNMGYANLFTSHILYQESPGIKTLHCPNKACINSTASHLTINSQKKSRPERQRTECSSPLVKYHYGQASKWFPATTKSLTKSLHGSNSMHARELAHPCKFLLQTLAGHDSMPPFHINQPV